MKRGIALLLAALMIFSLAACGTKSNGVAQQTQTLESQEPAAASAEPTPADADPAQPETTGTEQKILIVYFTPANSDTVDAVSSATPRVGDLASVAYVAQMIGEQVDADTAQIVAVDAYPLPYRETADQAKQEQNNDARPAFTLDVDPEDYDVIFFGYPIWWYHVPMIVRNFFETYDLSGKTVIPFVLHAGSRDGGTFREIRELEPDATVLDGLAIAGERADRAQKDVNNWLAGLSY